MDGREARGAPVAKPPTMKLSRRHFGIGMGAAAFFSSVISGFREREARAAGAAAKNLIVLTSGDGCIPDEWSFQSILGPLATYRDQMVVLRGVSFEDKNRNSNHNGAEVALRGSGTGLFGGASVDHYLAKAKSCADLNGNAFGLVIPMTNDAPGSTQSRVSYDKTGTIAKFPHTPLSGFKKLFGAVADPGAAAEGSTFVDLSLDEMKSLRAPLGASEKLKLDACIDSLHRIQQGAAGGPRKIRCEKPAPPSTIDTISGDQFAAVAKAHIDLAVLALQCNVTNVLTLQFAEDQNFTSVFGNVPGVASSASQHGSSHANDATYLAMQKWYSTQCAYLLDRLKAADLLSQTIVFRAFDFGRGDHQGQKLSFVPYFLAGAPGTLGAGRELDVSSATASHHGLLAAVCAAMGAPVPAGAVPLAGVVS